MPKLTFVTVAALGILALSGVLAAASAACPQHRSASLQREDTPAGGQPG